MWLNVATLIWNIWALYSCLPSRTTANTLFFILLKRPINLKLNIFNNATSTKPPLQILTKVAWKAKPWNLKFKCSKMKILTLSKNLFKPLQLDIIWYKHITNLTTQIDQLINESQRATTKWSHISKSDKSSLKF